jgi:hypothetical protein
LDPSRSAPADIVARVVEGGRGTAINAADAASLVDTAAGVDAVAAETAWGAMTAVCGVGKKARTRSRLAAASAFAVATSTLRRGDCSYGEAAACLRAVANLCGGDLDDTTHEANVAAALDAGVHAAIADAMRRVDRSVDVALAAYLAVSRLCRVDGARIAIVDAGGIAAVVVVMRRHGDSTAVQEQGCVLIRVLVGDDDDDDEEEAQDDREAAVAAAGGVDAVLTAMQRHARVARVQETGCAALACICNDDSRRVAIVAAEGVQVRDAWCVCVRVCV